MGVFKRQIEEIRDDDDAPGDLRSEETDEPLGGKLRISLWEILRGRSRKRGDSVFSPSGGTNAIREVIFDNAFAIKYYTRNLALTKKKKKNWKS